MRGGGLLVGLVACLKIGWFSDCRTGVPSSQKWNSSGSRFLQLCCYLWQMVRWEGTTRGVTKAEKTLNLQTSTVHGAGSPQSAMMVMMVMIVIVMRKKKKKKEKKKKTMTLWLFWISRTPDADLSEAQLPQHCRQAALTGSEKPWRPGIATPQQDA